MAKAIKVENLSKAYQLGNFGTGTISRDLERFWARVRGKEDPFLKIGEVNDRAVKGGSDIVWSLKDLNFDIEQGDSVGIIGRNGAGKSTLLKVLSRVTSPTTGSVKVKGRIASLLEVGTGFHPELSGRENIYLNGAILGMRKAEIKRKFDEIVDFSGVERYIDTPVKRYSSGMYVRLAFAVAAHLESEILVVDEVLAVGDAEFQKKCLGKMGAMSKSEGRTVLFVSHNMAAITQLCSRAMLLKNGMIDYVGTTNDTIDQYLKVHGELLSKDIEFATERSGNKSVYFTKFQILSTLYEPVSDVHTGDDIIFEFDIKVKTNDNRINLGFSISDQLESFNTVLYSAYQNHIFKVDEGDYKVSILLKDLSIAKSKLFIFGRIENNNEEADWLKVPLGEINIAKGDFYKTGSEGFINETTMLIKGEWKLRKH